MSSFFVTTTSRSLSLFMEKQDNKPLHHTRIVAPIQELPWGSCLKNSCYLHLFYQALFYCRIHLAKGRHCTMENVSNQYNIKAADYHFEADIMAVMIAADTAIEW